MFFTELRLINVIKWLYGWIMLSPFSELGDINQDLKEDMEPATQRPWMKAFQAEGAPSARQ